jgi:hypothetical protein
MPGIVVYQRMPRRFEPRCIRLQKASALDLQATIGVVRAIWQQQFQSTTHTHETACVQCIRQYMEALFIWHSRALTSKVVRMTQATDTEAREFDHDENDNHKLPNFAQSCQQH